MLFANSFFLSPDNNQMNDVMPAQCLGSGGDVTAMLNFPSSDNVSAIPQLYWVFHKYPPPPP